MATTSSPPTDDGLLPQFPSGEAAVTHIKRFCFATSRRTCRLERTKSGGNCKLLVCASNASNNISSHTNNTNVATRSPSDGDDHCPWFVRVNRSRKPNERGWRVKDTNLQHSERCLSAENASKCVPDARTIAHALVTGSAGTKSSTTSDARAIGSVTATSVQTGVMRIGANGGNMNPIPTTVDAETPARVLREHIKTTLDVDVKKRTLYRLKTKLLRIQDELSSGCTSSYSGAGIGSTSSGVKDGTDFYGSHTTSSSAASALAADRYATSFQWIESLLHQFCELNPGSVTELQVDAGNRFQRAIVVPKHFADAVVMSAQTNRDSSSPLQRIVSIQTQPLVESLNVNSNTNWGFAGVQMNLIARDGNCQEFVIATAILHKPDAESFQWVLERLRAAGINLIDSGGDGHGNSQLLVFCDRRPNSAFVMAVQKANPSSSLSNLLFAPGDLVRFMLSEKLISELERVYVLQAQAAQHTEDFRAVLDRLRVYRPHAASFLESLDPRTWAVYANLDRRLYGWTGEVALGNDSEDQTPSDRQHQNPFECLYESMNAMMKDLFERSENARTWSKASSSSNGMSVTPAAQQLLDQELSVIEDYDVRPCNPELVYVRHVNKTADHRTRKVNFAAKPCTCAFSQQLGIPCRHVGAALKFAGKMDSVYEFIDSYNAVSSYAQAFGGKFIQIPLEEDLQVNLTHLPPEMATDSSPSASAGGDRPNKRKAQGGHGGSVSAGATRSYKCSNCGSTGGHNKKTCSLAPQSTQ